MNTIIDTVPRALLTRFLEDRTTVARALDKLLVSVHAFGHCTRRVRGVGAIRRRHDAALSICDGKLLRAFSNRQYRKQYARLTVKYLVR